MARSARIATIPSRPVRGACVGDLNGDGKPDVAATAGIRARSRAARQRQRHARPKTDFGTEYYPKSIAIADLNGDGRPDLAIGTISTSRSRSCPESETARWTADRLRHRYRPHPRSRCRRERRRQARSGSGELRIELRLDPHEHGRRFMAWRRAAAAPRSIEVAIAPNPVVERPASRSPLPRQARFAFASLT